ncbi:MAG: hypothetical protein KTR21_12700 [Rhodobacteraceae bacterium]|nr:hypothetical protein [Paracoccaceae bacterium]
MTTLVYRGVRYSREDLGSETAGEATTLRYRGFEYDPREAWLAARPIFSRPATRVYRGVSDSDDGPGGNAFAAVAV